jgi:hypothetical protein
LAKNLKVLAWNSTLRERRRKKIANSAKVEVYVVHVSPYYGESVKTFQTLQWKVVFGGQTAHNGLVKGLGSTNLLAHVWLALLTFFLNDI